MTSCGVDDIDILRAVGEFIMTSLGSSERRLACDAADVGRPREVGVERVESMGKIGMAEGGVFGVVCRGGSCFELLVAISQLDDVSGALDVDQHSSFRSANEVIGQVNAE